MKNTKVMMRKRLIWVGLLLSIAVSACTQTSGVPVLPMNTVAPITFVTVTLEPTAVQILPIPTKTAIAVAGVPLATATVSPTATLIPTASPVPTLAPPARVDTPPPPLLKMTDPASPVTRLVIPALSLDTSVELSPIKNDTWDIDSLTDAVGHLQGTGSPGLQNNVVLAGHITLAPDGRPGPFYNLGYLTKGEKVILYHNDQSYTYEIDGMTTVKPTDVQVAYPTSVDRLTLITCLNYDDTQQEYTDRLVLWGHLAPEN